MLADADVDVDIAREQIATLGPDHPHIVLFVSENDRALAASAAIWDAPRLGAIDPNVEPYKAMLEQEHLSVINMTSFPSHDFFNHGKFAEDPRGRRAHRPQTRGGAGADRPACRPRRRDHAGHVGRRRGPSAMPLGLRSRPPSRLSIRRRAITSATKSARLRTPCRRIGSDRPEGGRARRRGKRVALPWAS